ncbi:flagellin [Dechloromonas sp. ZS-1]|uniref:flagellin N-terminal helical domain-containing protein n=1 Tax=Dechloromonas sp. ZS-1 TaxID=3138067 RepID=UPI0031FD7B17
MPSIINTNLYSMTAQRNLNGTGSTIEVSLQRLSSGLRVNSAKDDAAGLAIATRIEAQERGMGVALKNVNDAVSATQVADGSLHNLTTWFQRIRELAVQSANGTYKDSDRQAMQIEVDQLASEYVRTVNGTHFNNLKLIDGSYTNQHIQIGANNPDSFSLSIGSAKLEDVTNIGLSVGTSTPVIALTTPQVLVGPDYNSAAGTGRAQKLTITDPTGTPWTYNETPGESARWLADEINNDLFWGGNGVVATATNSTVVDFRNSTGMDDGVTVSFKISGLGYEPDKNISFVRDTSAFPTIEADFANAINSAGFSYLTANAGGGGVTLTNSLGENIGLENFSVTGAASFMTNPTITLGISNTSIAPVPSTLKLSLAGTSGIGDQLNFAVNFYTNGQSGPSPKYFNIPLAAGGTPAANAMAVAAAINDPVSGYGPGVATVSGSDVLITSPPDMSAAVINQPGTTFANGSFSLSATRVNSVIYSGPNPVLFSAGGFESMHSTGINEISFDLTSADNAGVPQRITIPLGVASVYNPGQIAGQIAQGLNNSLGGAWNATNSGSSVTLSYNGNTNISFSNGAQNVLGVIGDGLGTGFTVSTQQGTNVSGNGIFSMTSSDIETFSPNITTPPSSIIFGGKTLTAGTENDSAIAIGELSLQLPSGFVISSDFVKVAGLIDVSTAEAAMETISIADAALDKISMIRAGVGAAQSRFDGIVSNLQIARESASSTRSRILDADYAAETAQHVRTQMLRQAGAAILAQANAQPQNVLELLTQQFR